MKSDRRAALFGIVLGSICGIAGIGAGIYVGVIKPIQESGGTDKLPLPVIITTCVLLALFVFYLIVLAVSNVKKKKNKPSEW